MNIEAEIIEIKSRLKRIETKITRFLADIGHSPEMMECKLSGENIVAPGFNTPLSQVLRALPQEESEIEYDILVNGKVVAVISRP